MFKLLKMKLKEALFNFSKERARKRLTKPEFNSKYIDTRSLAIRNIKKMPKQEQVRTDLIIPTKLAQLIIWLKSSINYSLERIVVKRVKQGGKYIYILFDGHHRFTALKKIGYTHIVVDLIEIDNATRQQIKDFKYVLNQEYPKAGNSVNDIIGIIRDDIEEQYAKLAKESKLARKKVKACAIAFFRRTSSYGIVEETIQKEIIQKLYKEFSSHKEAMKSGKIWKWFSNGNSKLEDYNDLSYIENIVMGRHKDHPECRGGYAGLDHLSDPDNTLQNRIYLNNSIRNILNNLVYATYQYKFTTDYNRDCFNAPVLFLLYVDTECNSNLNTLEKKREELVKYFYAERHKICTARVREYVHSSSRYVSKKEQRRIYNKYKRMAGFLGFVPQVDGELGFVTSKSSPYVYPYEEDFYYA